MNRISFKLTAAMLALAATLLGCDTEKTGTYDILINWNVAGGQGDVCAAMLNGPNVKEQVEFKKVRISIYKDADATEPMQDPVEVNCADYSYTLNRLERGSYYVRIGALADFGGDYLPYYQAESEVDAPGIDEGYKFVLTQGQGSIKVTWSFDNKQMCNPNKVDTIEISLESGDKLKCKEGMHLIEDVYWSKMQLNLAGYDSDGEKTWYGEYSNGESFEVKPGQVYEAHVELSEF